jgi:hypothetical protein
MCTRQEWTQRIQTLAQEEWEEQRCRVRVIKELEAYMPDETSKTGDADAELIQSVRALGGPKPARRAPPRPAAKA